MKYLKMLGLAAVAAMALTAVIGAGTASAATICTTDTLHASGTACGTNAIHGWHAKAETPIKASTTEAKLTSGFINVTCESTAEGKITNATTGHGDITSLTFINCIDNFGRPCTANSTASAAVPWTVTTAYTSGTNGTMTVHFPTGTFTCKNPFNPSGAEVHCEYTANTATVTATGSHTEPKLDAVNVSLTKHGTSSVLCSNTATWNGTYKVTTPSSLVVTP